MRYTAEQIIDAGAKAILTVYQLEKMFQLLDEKDAKLKDAAPDLLKSCKSLLYLIEELGVKDATAINEAISAINKATK